MGSRCRLGHFAAHPRIPWGHARPRFDPRDPAASGVDDHESALGNFHHVGTIRRLVLDDDHVTGTNDHVTGTNDHVTGTNDHVTNDNHDTDDHDEPCHDHDNGIDHDDGGSDTFDLFSTPGAPLDTWSGSVIRLAVAAGPCYRFPGRPVDPVDLVRAQAGS
jgi:hypothetical protein